MRKWRRFSLKSYKPTKPRIIKTLYMMGRLCRSDVYLEFYGNYFHPKHRYFEYLDEIIFLQGMQARGYRWIMRYSETMKKWKRRLR